MNEFEILLIIIILLISAGWCLYLINLHKKDKNENRRSSKNNNR